MTMYLGKKGSKMFHDPLAVCVAIDPRVCEFREVTLYRSKQGWGSVLSPGSGTFISVAYHRPVLLRLLAGLEVEAGLVADLRRTAATAFHTRVEDRALGRIVLPVLLGAGEEVPGGSSPGGMTGLGVCVVAPPCPPLAGVEGHSVEGHAADPSAVVHVLEPGGGGAGAGGTARECAVDCDAGAGGGGGRFCGAAGDCVSDACGRAEDAEGGACAPPGSLPLG